MLTWMKTLSQVIQDCATGPVLEIVFFCDMVKDNREIYLLPFDFDHQGEIGPLLQSRERRS